VHLRLTLRGIKKMKKLLIASTALVATAGMAAAEVSLSGYAEMGIKDNGTDTVFHHDLDVKFSLSGETDGGLTFGATIDLDEVAGGIGSEVGPHSVWIKGGFGSLTMGDTDGAFDWAMTEVGMGSAIADDHTTHSGFNFNSGLDGSGDGGQVLRYDNTFGDFGVAISYEMGTSAVAPSGLFVFDPVTGVGVLDAGTAATDDVLGLGLKYTADLGGATLALGLGYQDNSAADIVGLSVKTSFGAVDVALNYSDHSVSGSHTAIGLGYTTGDLLLSANYGEYETGADGFGLAANYSLGGGATVMAAYGSGAIDTFSLGLGLSF
jgi:outer membrane protein OmpU